jgi:hypothetical protein
MRARFALLLVAASCARPSPLLQAQQHPRVRLTATAWIERCRGRIEVARLALVRLEPAFDHLKVDVNDAPWNPRIDFETRIGENGLWWGGVMRGHHPCDQDERGHRNLSETRGFSEWRDSTSEFPMLVDRKMRIGEDVAWFQADHVPDNTAIAFRREMQLALRECLLDAQGVTLAKPPPDLCDENDDVE